MGGKSGGRGLVEGGREVCEDLTGMDGIAGWPDIILNVYH